MRAIKLLEIKAIRNNRNHWVIDRDSLVLWVSSENENGRAHTNAHPENVEELKALHRENADLRSRVEAAERDRDAWREQAKRDQAALHEAVKRRWWRW
jgi:molecular chaperone GrpE (heat shock protein)